MGGCTAACGFGIRFGAGEGWPVSDKKARSLAPLKDSAELRSAGADECVRPYVSIVSL